MVFTWFPHPFQFHARKDESSSDEDDVRGRGARDRAPPSKRMKNEGDEEEPSEWAGLASGRGQ